MLVIVTKNVPLKLRGRLSLWLIEIRAGVYIGKVSGALKEKILAVVTAGVHTGNVVVAWSTNTETGYDFLTFGKNRRTPTNLNGLLLVSFCPKDSKM